MVEYVIQDLVETIVKKEEMASCRDENYSTSYYDKNEKNETILYYDMNADEYVISTKDVDFSEMQEHFLKYIPYGGKILDFGCGSGRDTKYFMDRNFNVDAVDGSEKLCKLARDYVGVEVRHMMFQELDSQNMYDGIWACASLLHLNKEALAEVFHKLFIALKDDGILYASFKYGKFEGTRNGRFFTDFDEESFGLFLKKVPELRIREQWVSGDVRKGRGGEKWLNLILEKSNIV